MFTAVKNSFLLRKAAVALAVIFFINSVMPTPVMAQALQAVPSAPSFMATSGAAFTPVYIKALKVRENEPLVFDFVVDNGSTGFQKEALKKETEKLAKYFLAAVTIPEKELWVNLSPYENDRIIPSELGLTEMGREMLAQDSVLKQMAASATNPDSELGKLFWGRVYAKAQEVLGTTDIPLDTFNKIWIVPGNAKIYEKDNTAVLGEATLKVMLDQDYIALGVNEAAVPHGGEETASSEARALSTQVMKDVVLPEIEKMVNTSKEFAPLRQLYGAIVLATWYKQALKESLLAQVYANQNKIAGVNSNDPAATERIYQDYLQQFKQGAYSFIKEDADLLTGEVIPRKYFSGGEDFSKTAEVTQRILVEGKAPSVPTIGEATLMTVALTKPDAAQNTSISGEGLLNEHKDQIVLRSETKGLKRLDFNFELTPEEQSAFLASIKNEMKARNAEIEKEADKVRVVTVDILLKAAAKALPHARSTEKAKIGLLPGTLNPVTYANLTFATAGTIDAGLNGVVVANGGIVPEKPYTPSAEIRNDMLQAAIKGEGLEDQIASSNIRQQMVDLLSKPFLGVEIGVQDEKGKGFVVTGKELDVQRRKMDIAAFIWLFSAYPNVEWTYMVDSSKIRQYGMKNEQELLQLLLARSVKVLYMDSENREIDPAKDFRAYDWLKVLADKGMFKKITTKAAADIQLQAVRKAVTENDPVTGRALIPSSVYDYIAEQPTLRTLYAWEYKEIEADNKVVKGEITQAVADYFQVIAELDKATPYGAMPDSLKKSMRTVLQSKIALLTEIYSVIIKNFKQAGVSKEEAVQACLMQLRNLDAQKDSSKRIISESMADRLESFILEKLMSVLADFQILEDAPSVVAILDSIKEAISKDFVGAKQYVHGRMVYDRIVEGLRKEFEAGVFKSENAPILREILDVLTWLMIEKALSLTVHHLMGQDLSKVMSDFKFGLFSAPPGGGKGELGERIYKRYGALVQKFVLITTRPIRPNEAQEREYHFRTVQYLAGMVPSYALSEKRGFNNKEITNLLLTNGYAKEYSTTGLKDNIKGIQMIKDIDGTLEALLAQQYSPEKTAYIVKCLQAARAVKVALDGGKIIVTLVNKQMQGLTTVDINDQYVGYYGKDKSGDVMLGMSDVIALMEDFKEVTMDGLENMKAKGAKIALLEGGIGWYVELKKSNPALASVFLSPFTDQTIDDNTKTPQVRHYYQAMYLKSLEQHDSEKTTNKFISQKGYVDGAKQDGDEAGKMGVVRNGVVSQERFLKLKVGKDDILGKSSTTDGKGLFAALISSGYLEADFRLSENFTSLTLDFKKGFPELNENDWQQIEGYLMQFQKDYDFNKFLKEFEANNPDNVRIKDIHAAGQEERLAQLKGEFYFAAYETTVRIHKREIEAGVMTTSHDNFIERAVEAALQVVRRKEYSSVLVNAFQQSPVAFWAMMYRLTNGFSYEIFGSLSKDIVEKKFSELDPYFNERSELIRAAEGWRAEFKEYFNKDISVEDLLDTQEFFEIMKPELKNGQPVADRKTIRPRTLVHRTGDWHRDIRVFVMDTHGNIFVQKRGPKKDMEPNLIAHGVGGHTGLGETYRQNAIREIREEIGLEGIDEARLHSFGVYSEEVFGANEQKNRSHYGLYAYIASDEEVARMKVDYLDGISKEGTLWMPYATLKAEVAADNDKRSKFVASFYENLGDTVVAAGLDEIASADASQSPLGGIDLNAQLLNMSIERSGEGVKVNIDPALIEQIRTQGVEGFAPVIINIVPVSSVTAILGMNNAEQPTALTGAGV